MSSEPNGKMTKTELAYLLRALRANAKAAKTSIVNLGAKLKAEFEVQLNTTYPPNGDPVWEEEYQGLLTEWKKRQDRVNKRSAQRGIPKRFRPAIAEPNWCYGGQQCFNELRPELRRLAHAQIDAMVKSRLEGLEAQSAQVELSILSNGFITEEAKRLFAELPTVASLIPPIKLEEIIGLLEGKNLNSQPLIGQAEGRDSEVRILDFAEDKG
jgi:hypothetical protein